METITLQDTATETKLFTYVDPFRAELDSLGASRIFTINWLEAQPDEEIHSGPDARRGDHLIEVVVWYPLGPDGFKWLDAQKMVMQDRHVIIKQLRDDAKWIGFNADNTGTDIGLHKRWPEGEEIETDDGSLIFRSKWACKVYEVETV
ncbi:MAG: hypothetical protein V3W44_09580 [Dehalococcoidales bacterium]